ncbi:sulfatase-like hydrolase/transferase [Seonamhaeicola marinus]|uniref:Sulfatase-like hydrolase/transferase n=1 Tax=Seonamhaeicola marinus TaxID=1912246 RepID=A0A5D0I4R8_9FLAO|nr:sulfatase-like hydrolase/transferase [Seonamhaeicola marinus]TYA78733.1 sulfatase-like hydrolase/transferase [Seonamhaeicola marinus]
MSVSFPKWAGVLCFICVFNFISAQQKQPNILWIITDDQRADALECYNRATTGKSESQLGFVMSPNIDKLAEEGTMFVNAYNNSPMCAISRASMHMGRYPFRSGHYKFFSHQEADVSKPLISQILREKGYGTAVFGKTHWSVSKNRNKKKNQPNDMFDLVVSFKSDLQNKGFGDIFTSGATVEFPDGIFKLIDRKETAVYPDGTRYKYITNDIINGVPEADRKIHAKVDEDFDILRIYTRPHNTLIIGGENPHPAGQTIDGLLVKEVKSYLKNANTSYKTLSGRQVDGVNTTKPLFLNLGFTWPHTPVLPPKEYRKLFKNKRYAIPEFSTEELSNFPPQLVIHYNECKSDQLKKEEKLQAIRDYYAFCAYGDALIGDAVEAFKKYNQERGDEWLIVYTVGDHGWHLNEQGVMAKFGPWKQSVHDAIIVVSSDKSKFPAGKVIRDITEYVDFVPTFLEAAGVDTSNEKYEYLDGYNLQDVVSGKAPKREYALGEINVVNGHRAYMRNEHFAFSMRTRDMWDNIKSPNQNKNVRWTLTCDRPKADMALYDLRVDPLEKRNLADHRDYRALADWFREKLGNITLGDGRVECDWSLTNSYNISNFAGGADDKKLNIPEDIIPKI